ncbi:unnamed protein product [Rotaria sp. Silwood1]|nr:unnamed protein product [Rotaria sp. Silwood1]
MLCTLTKVEIATNKHPFFQMIEPAILIMIETWIPELPPNISAELQELVFWLYPTHSSTQSHPWYTDYQTASSTAWYQQHSSTPRYPTQSSTQWYPWHTDYQTASSTAWYQQHSSTSRYPTHSSTQSHPWYTDYQTASSTAWYQQHSSTPRYPTRSSTQWYPWYTDYETTSSTAWYQLHSSTPRYPTQPSTHWYYNYTSYPNNTSTPAATTEDFYWTSTSSQHPNLMGSFHHLFINSFTTVDISRAKNVVLQGTMEPTPSPVEFYCSSNMFHDVSINLTNMTLTIDSPGDCDVTIYVYELQTIQIGAVSRLRTSNYLRGNQLKIEASDTSQMMLNNITFEDVEVRLLKSSNVTLSGSTEQLHVIQLGQGTFDSRSLSTNHATLFTDNSGLVKIKSNSYLSLSVGRMGNVIWCSPYGDIKTERTMNENSRNIIYHCD